jgi:hypothetical protein
MDFASLRGWRYGIPTGQSVDAFHSCELNGWSAQRQELLVRSDISDVYRSMNRYITLNTMTGDISGSDSPDYLRMTDAGPATPTRGRPRAPDGRTAWFNPISLDARLHIAYPGAQATEVVFPIDQSDQFHVALDWIGDTNMLLAWHAYGSNGTMEDGCWLYTIDAGTGATHQLNIQTQYYRFHPHTPTLMAVIVSRAIPPETVKSRSLAIVDFKRNDIRYITNERTLYALWSPSGRYLAYTNELEAGDSVIRIAPWDERQQTVSRPTREMNGDQILFWSDDSKYIIYTRDLGAYSEIRLTSLDGALDTLVATDVASPFIPGPNGWNSLVDYLPR